MFDDAVAEGPLRERGFLRSIVVSQVLQPSLLLRLQFQMRAASQRVAGHGRF